jgi:hypothetical protein
MKINYKNEIGSGSWHAEFSLAEATLMRLSFGGRNIMELLPARINKQSEAQSLPQKTRIHQKQDGMTVKYSLSNLIPFGSEPGIERSFEFGDGFVRVIEDINTGKYSELENLDVDPVILPGPWAKIAVMSIPPAGKALPEPEWRELTAGDKETIFEQSYPFLAVMLKTEDGTMFELGMGDDLWRWQDAGNIPGHSALYTVCGNSESIEVKRVPALLQNKEEASEEIQLRHSWRFKWYFAWCNTAVEEQESSRKKHTLDLNDYSETGAAYPCLHSAFSRKKLRQALRGIIANNPDTDIILLNADAHICKQHQHLDRGKKSNFLHWDAWDFMELYLWANHKAQFNGSTFSISTGVDTPLNRRLAQKTSQRICGK